MSVTYSIPGMSSIERTEPYKAPLIIPSPPLATIKVADPEMESGYRIVNRSDFDPSVDTEYSEKAAAKPKAGK